LFVAFTIDAKPSAVAASLCEAVGAGTRFNACSEPPTGRRLQASYVLKRPLAAHARKRMHEEKRIEPRADSIRKYSKIEQRELDR
jgi:hypothetical protein